MAHVRRSFGEAAMSVAALAVLLITLMAIDNNLRQEVVQRYNHPEIEMANVEGQARGYFAVFTKATRDYWYDHRPLVSFVIVALVLLMFMLRM